MENSKITGATPFTQTYFHGTKADLKIGDSIKARFNAKYENG